MRINAKRRLTAAPYASNDVDNMLQFMEEFYSRQQTFDSGRKKIAAFFELFDVTPRDIVKYAVDDMDFSRADTSSVDGILEHIDDMYHGDYRYMLYFVIEAYPQIAKEIMKQY